MAYPKTNPNADAFASPKGGGLTIREYFAAQALAGLLASGIDPVIKIETLAVVYADDLIEALNSHSIN